MRNKKLLSTVVATALVVSTMAMPVMAAEEGSFEVDVTTKTGVLRVQVPTSMAVAVDQFEIGERSQINAGTFDMTNQSEMNVKVEVTSEVELKTGISLVSTAEAAGDSTNEGEVWLGTAAKTSATMGEEYDDLKTGDATTPKKEVLGELTDKNSNVTSFASDTKKAVQTFYLEKGTGDTEYKLAVPDAADQVDKTYTKFYELTAQTDPSDDAGLQTLVDSNDIYVVPTNNIGEDGTTVTKIGKGTTVTSGTYANTNTYYIAADTETAATFTAGVQTLPTGSVYLYAAMENEGGKAGFTYIGKLSPKQETWTDEDIKKVNVSYKIGGVTQTRYDEIVDNCTYGLYKNPNSAPSISTTTYTYTSGTAVEVPVNLGAGSLAATGVESVSFNNNGTVTSLPTTRWSYSNGKVVFNGDYCGLLNNATRVHTITFNDAAKTTVNVTLQP